MKLNTATWIGSLIVLLGSTTANAQQPQTDAACHEARRARMLERFDANRDGKLDETERQNMWRARQARMQDRAHGDGEATDPAQREARRAAHMDQRFKMLDSDGNGRISRPEAAPACRLAERFDVIDTDHDGSLTIAELRTAAPPRRGHHHHGVRGDWGHAPEHAQHGSGNAPDGGK